jgi:predicted Zn-dependent peptidase
VAQHRWQAKAPELANQPVFARTDGYVLPGMFLMGTSVSTDKTADALANARKVLESLINTPATAAELDRAKSEIINEAVVQAGKSDAVPDPWLDAGTYRLNAVQDQPALLRAVTASDVQRVAGRLFKEPAVASVAIGEAAPLKTSLQGRVQFEVLGEIATPAPSTKSPTKPAGNANPR